MKTLSEMILTKDAKWQIFYKEINKTGKQNLELIQSLKKQGYREDLLTSDQEKYINELIKGNSFAFPLISEFFKENLGLSQLDREMLNDEKNYINGIFSIPEELFEEIKSVAKKSPIDVFLLFINIRGFYTKDFEVFIKKFLFETSPESIENIEEHIYHSLSVGDLHSFELIWDWFNHWENEISNDTREGILEVCLPRAFRCETKIAKQIWDKMNLEQKTSNNLQSRICNFLNKSKKLESFKQGLSFLTPEFQEAFKKDEISGVIIENVKTFGKDEKEHQVEIILYCLDLMESKLKNKCLNNMFAIVTDNSVYDFNKETKTVTNFFSEDMYSRNKDCLEFFSGVQDRLGFEQAKKLNDIIGLYSEKEKLVYQHITNFERAISNFDNQLEEISKNYLDSSVSISCILKHVFEQHIFDTHLKVLVIRPEHESLKRIKFNLFNKYSNFGPEMLTIDWNQLLEFIIPQLQKYLQEEPNEKMVQCMLKKILTGLFEEQKPLQQIIEEEKENLEKFIYN